MADSANSQPPVISLNPEVDNLLGNRSGEDSGEVKTNGEIQVPQGEPTKVGLKKTITLINGVTIIVGSIIGSGIFISPKGVQQQVGSVGLSLIVWVFGGLFSMCGAYCYAELGTLIHESGADYAYIMQSMGKFVAFLRLWVECIVVRPVTSTLIALAFSNYIIYPLFDNCPSETPDSAIRLLSVVCLLTIILINCYSTKFSTRVMDILTYAKLIALVVIIATGLVRVIIGDMWGPPVSSFNEPFKDSDWNPAKFAVALYSCLFAYYGWNFLNFVIEEMVNVKRDLPIAIGISLPLCTIIYVLANAAYYTTVTPAEMLESPAVAVMFAKRLYGPAWVIMPLFVALSCFGGVNGTLLTASRLFFVGGRHGQMPVVMTLIRTQGSTPAPAVIFVGSLAIVYLFFSSNLYVLLNYLAFVTWLALAISVASLLVFRFKEPFKKEKRAIKVPLFFPILYLIVSVFLVLLPLYQNPSETMMGVIVILTALPVYWVFICWKNKPRSFQVKVDFLTVLVQKILNCLPEENSKEQ
jgi:L-type amino acid transporter 8